MSLQIQTTSSLLFFFFSIYLLLLFSPPCTAAGGDKKEPPELTYHDGPLLTGELKLAMVWYGHCGRIQKNAIRAFVKSLNFEGKTSEAKKKGTPMVSAWWKMVESYQAAAKLPQKPIKVSVVRQVTDTSYSIGKVVTVDFVKPLLQKATEGDTHILPVIFTARDVSVQGLCTGKCSKHGVMEKQPYLIVGNPETECPEACAWPFRGGPALVPPSGDIGADSMVIAFAQGLADTVTNPMETGFYQEVRRKTVEAASACSGIFGSGATAGSNPGKVLKDPTGGNSYNAYGSSNSKQFLLPALWDPATKSCWTLM
ncbi:Protein EXORDIUM-like 2 [Linum grandiflorum]